MDPLGIKICTLPLDIKRVEYGVYGDLIRIYPNPWSIYLRGTVGLQELQAEHSKVKGFRGLGFRDLGFKV